MRGGPVQSIISQAGQRRLSEEATSELTPELTRATYVHMILGAGYSCKKKSQCQGPEAETSLPSLKKKKKKKRQKVQGDSDQGPEPSIQGETSKGPFLVGK